MLAVVGARHCQCYWGQRSLIFKLVNLREALRLFDVLRIMVVDVGEGFMLRCCQQDAISKYEIPRMG
jgi:hypothetical protein